MFRIRVRPCPCWPAPGSRAAAGGAPGRPAATPTAESETVLRADASCQPDSARVTPEFDGAPSLSDGPCSETLPLRRTAW